MKMISNRPEKRLANGISHSQRVRKSDAEHTKRKSQLILHVKIHWAYASLSFS